MSEATTRWAVVAQVRTTGRHTVGQIVRLADSLAEARKGLTETEGVVQVPLDVEVGARWPPLRPSGRPLRYPIRIEARVSEETDALVTAYARRHHDGSVADALRDLIEKGLRG